MAALRKENEINGRTEGGRERARSGGSEGVVLAGHVMDGRESGMNGNRGTGNDAGGTGRSMGRGEIRKYDRSRRLCCTGPR